ncbi:MAG: MogA/MoaB family molybdenum cofactor biosynthesis protein [Phycisphaerae bacterium]|nr:MogA/MoaB family molybdenum cofactor biosynthesis protein [Phycisphaerae bacterium]
MRAAILVSSDRCSRGEQQDRSGPAVEATLRERLGAEIVRTRVLPDDLDSLAACFAEWSRERPAIDLIVSTGGTGLSPRDVTPEAARSVIERDHPALMELARLRCRERSPDRSPRAYLSRGVAGVASHSLILTLPGSPAGAVETLEALVDLLPHAISLIRGSAADHAQAP